MPRKNSAADRFKAEMRAEMVGRSHIDDYLTFLRRNGDDGAEMAASLEADLIEAFSTEAGLRVLKLFEKSVLHNAHPNGSSDCALREMNAVRNFVLNLRRIVANG